MSIPASVSPREIVAALHEEMTTPLRCTTCGASPATAGLSVCMRHVRDELGITYRQLDYAVRAGYLKPGRQWAGNRYGSGSPRSWPEAELAVAKLMGRLTAAGLPLETAHRIARSGEARAEIAPGIFIEVTA